MDSYGYQPVFELTRGQTVESVHRGAVAVVDVSGRLVASYGAADTVTFLRSTAKPFQALPFITHGGQAAFHLTPREIALICASHHGTDEHVALAQSVQRKTQVDEADLLCGVHPPVHEATAEALRERHEQPTPNRHNCSGKHTGMLAFVHLLEAAGQLGDEMHAYIDPQHPIQQEILQTFAEMCDLPVEQVALGTDGCSAPNFAVPLRSAAYAYARLIAPEAGQVQPPERAAACSTITAAMMFNPDMVAGPGAFDTRLMEVAQGRIVSKGGAEGYQGIGLMPGALGEGSPGMGIALKIADGDCCGRARAAVTLDVLRQLGALSDTELGFLSEFGPQVTLQNYRKLSVGQGRPVFQLVFQDERSASPVMHDEASG